MSSGHGSMWHGFDINFDVSYNKLFLCESVTKCTNKSVIERKIQAHQMQKENVK